MRKLLIITALLMFSGIAFGQTLHKGSMIGVHPMTITLKADVTMDQFIDFFTSKWIPEVEKFFDGWKGILVKGNKGEHVNEYGLVWYIPSMEEYNKYYKSDGTLTDEMAAKVEDFQHINDELDKFGTWTSTFTDWVVQ
jgi:hypothetical protein